MLALAAAFLAAAPLPVAAAAPSPKPAPPARPSIMQQASDALARPAPATTAPALAPAAPAIQASPAVTLNRQVFGFAQAGALGDPTAGYPSWNFSLLSTVAYFGIHVDNSGNLMTGDTGWSVWNSTTLANLVSTAHAAGTRVVLTIVHQDLTSGMCSALQNGAATVAQTVAQVNAKGVDGVNIDYEGSSSTCPAGNGVFKNFVAEMRSGLGSGRSLTVDTYASSAAPGGDGFFDLPGMAPYVDGFFVMAYELDDSNWSALGCPSFCMNPTSAYSAYLWNDQKVASQYVATVGGAKTILGLPYYGWAACVNSTTENAVVSNAPQWTANTQLGVQGLNLGPQHTDSHDGVDHWYSGYPNSYGCTRELYIDDGGTLSAKYQVVNSYGLQGAGIWSLDMGGGLTSLWNAIAVNFSYVPGAPVSPTACPGNGYATVTWGPAQAPYGIGSYTATANPGGQAQTTGPFATTAAVGGLTNGQAYTFAVQAHNGYGGGPAASTASVSPGPPPANWPALFHPVAPFRVMDTRNGQGPVAPLGTVTVDPRGAGGVIPASGVDGVVLNVTVTNGGAPGYITVYADGTCRPTASNLNYGVAQQVAGLTQTGLGSDGKVAFFNGSGAGSVDVIADVVGYLSDTNVGTFSQYRPLAHPQRLLDSRDGTGGLSSPLGPGQGFDLQVGGAFGGQIPAGAAGVAVNVTVTDATANSYVYVHPTGQGGAASTVNFGPYQVVANRAMVALNNGRLTVFNSAGAVNVIVDVAGYFTAAADGAPGGTYTSMAPVRVYDSRSIAAPVAGGTWRKVQVAGLLSVPATARGVVFTLTGTNVTQPTFLAVDPLGTAVQASDVNLAPSRTVANIVVATPASDGTVEIYNSAGSTDIIADVVGWYS